MKVFAIIQRTSVDYEGTSDEVIRVFSTMKRALEVLKKCNFEYNVDFFINAYDVEN